MKKSVIALVLLAVLVIIVSPGLIGKLAEDSVGENLDWAARESGELVVTSEGFDRGWFSSEGQHRIALGNGSIRAAMKAAGTAGGDQVPALLIDTHIDHGLIPVSSMAREHGSLAPGLGSAVSTLAIELGGDETIELPGTIYSKIGLGGNLDSNYVLEAGKQSVDEGEVTWQPGAINIAASAKTGDVKFNGDIGAMTFRNDQQSVSIDGLSIVGQQANTPYGFYIGDVNLAVGATAIDAGGVSLGGMQGFSVKATSSVDDGLAAAAMHLELSGQTIPNFGDVSVVADVDLTGLDAVALGAVHKRLEDLAGAQDPSLIMVTAAEEFKDLFAAGLDVAVDQFDVALPMGTVEMKSTIAVPESDRATFAWTSLLLSTVASANVKVPESLIQFATSMNPQAGALVGMGYLKKEGDTYVMDASYEKGLLTINGAPIPIPMGAFQ